uniref:Hflx-type G domain-containing protein n=1 Tax=Attheya septentrionalis TaxID=420275 RepID=A0A6T7J2N9_9STRA|mmetsp:Transcript_28302/g.51582  ORF Transcript_28302/g.51582 Transcript_28302/m.51582 type:complete len:697 (+) Transcript_28302:244-2334(+)|eukprot:CAMPEP_0198279994 /NCGR_PEP_ID=MMETSP1449-20131203/174_1 /TAXON_ID=420275 /ORGANISM="Attheya septentrionalis, Strain CCMP2084" /LENGTH=696 /DNA_ID=CAMNT_0043975251 /DNA_START=210 /DNA_END=2300 /DNA_ORIENTATION=+
MDLTRTASAGNTCRGKKRALKRWLPNTTGSVSWGTVALLAMLSSTTTSHASRGVSAFTLASRLSSFAIRTENRMVAAPPSSSGEDKSTSVPPLFDLDESEASSSAPSLFQVKDMSSQQEFNDVDDDEEESDNSWEGQATWENDWDDSELNSDGAAADMAIPLHSTETSNESPTNDGVTEFARDQDDMLTEREDRMYVDESGQRRKVETCILVGVEDLSAKRSQNRMTTKNGNPEESVVYFDIDESLVEMRELIKTAGLELAGEVTQRLNTPNPRTYIGTGKVTEVEEMLALHDCCTVVFDAELSPGQQKALENAFNKKVIQNDFNVGSGEEGDIKVVDRTALILDIFAQHAKTREGKLQVSLALHEYRKPRLTKMWTHLERQSGSGGVGLRGPGESQLEIDKRLLRDRINVLKSKINDVQKQRDLHRKGRDNLGLPILALVGYTNAGKSTLLNFLTRAGVMAENILFATLDPTTRKIKLPGYKTHPEVFLTDTVGFIQKLPTHLVAAFRATLEEVREADVLIHVMDMSNPSWEKQEQAVLSVLGEIDCGNKPIIRVMNKIDLLDPDDAEYIRYEAAMMSDSVAVSSITGDGMQDFVAVVEDSLGDLLVPIEVEIPFDKGDDLNLIHEVGAVETVDYRATGTYVVGRVPKAVANRLAPYYVNGFGAEAMAKSKENFPDDEIDWVALGRGRHDVTKGL